jgi:hypothetical protein
LKEGKKPSKNQCCKGKIIWSAIAYIYKKKANTLEEVKRKVTKREDKLFHAINNTYMEFINTNINRIVALELSLLSNKPMWKIKF